MTAAVAALNVRTAVHVCVHTDRSEQCTWSSDSETVKQIQKDAINGSKASPEKQRQMVNAPSFLLLLLSIGPPPTYFSTIFVIFF